MLSLKEQERLLFDRWKAERQYTSFLCDGVPNEQRWNEQTVKITFVLKEANWLGGNEDLCQFLLEEHKGSYWKTWNNIARWSKALLEGGEYPRYVSKADKSYWLSRVSFMNLKKVGGGRQANNRELRKFAARDALFLQEQFAIYAPDIIVCCGKWITADILYQDVLPKETLSEWEKTSNGFDYFYTQIAGKSIPVVSFWHPQRIASHEVFKRWYEDMKQIGNDLLENRDSISSLRPGA